MEKSDRTIWVDFSRIDGIINAGVQRADIFMAFGLNAAQITPPISHRLIPDDDGYDIRMTPAEVTDERRERLLREFENWVISNGFRELTEVLSTFLYHLYQAAYRILVYADRANEGKLLRPEKLDPLGARERLARLSDVMQVDERWYRIVPSLIKARNCLAHRHGIIGAKDVDPQTGEFALTWLVWQPVITKSDGSRVDVAHFKGLIVKAGETLGLRPDLRQKTFLIGQPMNITRRELQEICLAVRMIGKDLIKQAEQLARNAGILEEETTG